MSNLVPPVRAPAKVPPAETPGLTGLLTLAVGVVVVASLYLAREVLIPITLAILLSFVLMPLVDLMRRIRLPHVAAVLLAVLIGFGTIAAVGGVIGLQVAGLASDVPNYAVTLQRKFETVKGATVGRLTTILARFERQPGQAASSAPASNETRPGPVAPAQKGALGEATQQPVPVEVRQPAAQPLELARTILSPIVEPLSNLLIVIIIAVFVMMQREDLRDRLIRLFGSNDLHRTTVALDDAASRLARYFLSQLGINASFGAIVAAGLWFIGVPSPLLWGVLAGLLRFVPYIGPVIGGILPAAVAAAVTPGWSMVVWTAGLFVAVEAVVGQVVEPLIYGHSTGLSPAAVVISAIFWTWIWGPIGLVLSTPLTLCLVVMGRHIERLEFLDVLLGDRPALTPVENFYQRMLAEDPDETQSQAELLLKERSLSAYYDEVALKGLQLAANDAARGVLSEGRLEFIRTSVRQLIDDLGAYEDRDPQPADKESAGAVASQAERNLPAPPAPARAAPVTGDLAPAWRGKDPVLCLAGRGPLDEAACAMLAQLLSKHGLGGRVATHEAASREAIRTLDLEGVAMICVTYLEISGTPSNLRYLLRRLRARAPQVPILVGLWPSDDEVMRDKRMRSVIEADHYASSLKEAVETCVAESHRARGDAANASDDGGTRPVRDAALPAGIMAAVT